MSTTAPIPSVAPDVAPVQTVKKIAAPVEIQDDLRLVIEEDKAAGSYVYKTVDPKTGKVVSQVPREELLRMREASDYKPGSVIDSRS
jgi:flagellar protein FlaG